MAETREYRLIRRVAETDFAESFRAVALRGGKNSRPALVQLLMPRATEAEILRRIKQQVALLSSTSSPNLLVPWDFGRAGGRWAIALDCPPGHFLDVVLGRIRTREFSVPLPRAVHLIAETANGLASLHQRGLCHGGIGPEDVLMGFDGSASLQSDSLRLVLESQKSTRHLAQRGRKRFRAPELARGSAPGPTADVFALGAVAFELVTGQSFEGPGRAGSTVRADSVQLPSRLDRRIPAKFDQVFLRAIDAAPSRRYPDAAAFRDALWEYLDAMGQVVTPAELSELAVSVFPNEVVSKSFDPEEQPTGSIPVPGTFSLEASTIPEPVAAHAFGTQAFSSEAEQESSQAPGVSGSDTAERDSTIKLTIPPLHELEDDTKTDAEETSGDERITSETREPRFGKPEGGHGAAPAPAPKQQPGSSKLGRESVSGAKNQEGLQGEFETNPPAALEGGRDFYSRPRTNVEIDASLGAVALDEARVARIAKEAEAFTRKDPHAEPEVDENPTDPTQQRPTAAAWASQMQQAEGAALTARREKELVFGELLGRQVPLLIVAAVAIVFAALGFTIGRLTAPTAVLPPPEFLAAPKVSTLDAATGAGERTHLSGLGDTVPPEEPAVEAEPPAAEKTVVLEEDAPAVKTPRQQTTKTGRARVGRLTVTSNQRARIFVDGTDTGRYTPLQGYRLRAGSREIRLVTNDGRTETRQVRIRGGQVTRLRVRIQ